MRNAMRTHLWSERQNQFVFVAWQPWQSWHHRVKWFRLSAFNSLTTITTTTDPIYVCQMQKSHIYLSRRHFESISHDFTKFQWIFIRLYECDSIEIWFESLAVPIY